jgi:hypothetical protein
LGFLLIPFVSFLAFSGGCGYGVAEGDAEGDELVSETSTLLPTTSRASPPLTSQSRHHHHGPESNTSTLGTRYHTDEEQAAETQEPVGSHRTRRTWRTTGIIIIFNGEAVLRMLMLAGMTALVLLAVVRAIKGGFSPGLLVGGGLMMVLCIVADRREVRGRLMRD